MGVDAPAGLPLAGDSALATPVTEWVKAVGRLISFGCLVPIRGAVPTSLCPSRSSTTQPRDCILALLFKQVQAPVMTSCRMHVTGCLSRVCVRDARLISFLRTAHQVDRDLSTTVWIAICLRIGL